MPGPAASTAGGRNSRPSDGFGALALPEAGIYVIEVRLERSHTIQVGKLGDIDFAAGCYLYVGSAMRSMPHRLRRHASRSKRVRWHIDYLTSRGRVTGLALWPADKHLECRIAQMLSRDLDGIARFGCSDCRCNTHLFRGDLNSSLATLDGALEPERVWSSEVDASGVPPRETG